MALDEDNQGTLVAVCASPVSTHLHFLSFTGFAGGAKEPNQASANMLTEVLAMAPFAWWRAGLETA
jgi:hypothetical protein